MYTEFFNENEKKITEKKDFKIILNPLQRIKYKNERYMITESNIFGENNIFIQRIFLRKL